MLWLICAVIGGAIGQGKGLAGTGVLLGLLLGFIGIIIVILMKPKEPEPAFAPSGPPSWTGPAGWFADPSGLPQQRYYDGRQWTRWIAWTNPDGSTTTYQEQP